jgi:anti-anti-sigma factor
MEKDFEVKLDGSVLTILLGKDLATANAPMLTEELTKYKEQGITKVVFDATKLTFLASSGIRVVIFCKQKLGGSPEIVFVNCAKEIYDIFDMTGIRSFITFVEK